MKQFEGVVLCLIVALAAAGDPILVDFVDGRYTFIHKVHKVYTYFEL